MNLKTLLYQHKHQSRQKLTGEQRQVLETHADLLRSSRVGSSVPKPGAMAPNFSLPDHQGNNWELAKALGSGPVILKFYRGTWCPYCNLELRAYQARLPEIRDRGASFVAVSPERPDFAGAFTRQEEIEFPVLFDFGNEVARRFGLQFTLEDSFRRLLKDDFGNDLEKKNGENSWTLPVPGIFVIVPSGRIDYSFAELDFTIRADPDEVISALSRNLEP